MAAFPVDYAEIRFFGDDTPITPEYNWNINQQPLSEFLNKYSSYDIYLNAGQTIPLNNYASWAALDNAGYIDWNLLAAYDKAYIELYTEKKGGANVNTNVIFTRGLEANLPSAQDGAFRFTTDTQRLYIDNSSQHLMINPDAVINITRSGTTFTMTKADGSTSTFSQKDSDTHYSAALITCASSTGKTNTAATNGSVYLNLIENDTVRSSNNIVGSGATTVVSDANGKITISSATYANASSSAAGLMSAADKTKLDGIAEGANKYTYTLPTATSTTLGGVKIGSNISVSSGTISLSSTNITNALGFTPAQATHTHAAADITSGTFTTDQIPALAAGKITSGTFAAARIPAATTSAKGGVIIGSNITVSSGTISITKDNVIAALGYTPPTADNDTKVTMSVDNTTAKVYVMGTTTTSGTITTAKYNAGIYMNMSAGASAGVLMGAAWNDYAEFRETTAKIEAGRVVVENGNDTLSLSTERLLGGANVVSDTYGFAIGETEQSQTPLAVSGRVLAYPCEPRETFSAGDPVCSGPNGTVSKMTREEVMMYPDRMIGTVSAIPDYEIWGSGNVKVNGRIWIKI